MRRYVWSAACLTRAATRITLFVSNCYWIKFHGKP
jgi:hypothetical protein